MEKKAKKDNSLDKVIFIPAFILLIAFIIAGVFFSGALGDFLNKALYGMGDYFGWFINLIAMGSMITVVLYVVTKYGDIRIGGKDATTDFKTFNWVAMSLCGGIGTGLLFWAMAEPIFHFATPPVAAGVTPFSREAGIFAVSQAMWNWSFVQYSMYTACAVAFALAGYNRKKMFSFGPIIDSAFGKEMRKTKTFIHGLMIFCLTGAVANSMGVGLMQIGAGIEALFGIPQSAGIWLIIALAIGFVFILSSLAGLDGGLKKLSTFTIYTFFGLLLYAIVFGDTVFMAKIGTESIAEIMDKWASKTMMLNTMAEADKWFADWNVQYWASFIVYAPVLGMFLSRLAKGRTIREFVLVNVIAPSIFCWVWIAVFGGMTISLQINGITDVWAAVNTHGMQSTVFQLLASLPLGKILITVFLVAIVASFSTLADPMASVLASLSLRKANIDDEPPRNLKIVMGVLITTMAYLLVASGGVNAVKGLFVLVGLPITFVMIICVVSAFKQMKQCYEAEDYLPED